jgi:hypothetical protein
MCVLHALRVDLRQIYDLHIIITTKYMFAPKYLILKYMFIKASIPSS